MNEYIALLIIYVIFLSLSYLVYLLMTKLKSFLFLISGLLYCIGIYFYFNEIEQLHDCLRDNKIYIEFGHASLSLLLLMAFCYLNGLIVVFIALYKRQKNRQNAIQ
jgi:asparagine N-glycosylation enzyme membrane subunit Stt3